MNNFEQMMREKKEQNQQRKEKTLPKEKSVPVFQAGSDPETDSVMDLLGLVNHHKDKKAPVTYYISQEARKNLERLSKERGFKSPSVFLDTLLKKLS